MGVLTDIARFIGAYGASVPTSNTFDEHQQWIREGEQAARAGIIGREHCPYDETTQSDAWNFWVYGNDNEASAIFWEKVPEEEKQGLWLTTSASPTEVMHVQSRMRQLQDKYGK